MGLSKKAAELLASDLKSRNMLTKTTKVAFYRDRDRVHRSFFSQDSNLVYCNDIKGLINKLKPASYKVDEWRLFIDSSTRSLKGVLLHNTNKYDPSCSFYCIERRIYKHRNGIEKIMKSISG